MNVNFLKINDSKSEFMLIGSPQQLSKISIPFITVGDSHIKPVSQVRNLGVIFDSSMTFKNHISNTVRSASFHIRNIGRFRKHLDCASTEKIVHSFVTSRLDMGNSLLFGLPDVQLSRLQRIQNTAARVVTLTTKYSHIKPVLLDLHWLPVSSRIIYKLLLIVFKSLNGQAPAYIQDMLNIYKPSRNLRSANRYLLQEIKSYRTWGTDLFLLRHHVSGINIKTSTSIHSFKTSLKTHLMSIV